ncbi:MAG: family 78 glycoside hydrolase catalytic domain [Chloroflexi bacterium]|nr:family 78 glycoside hydrolase catalytic domain [Chloroflexota bacterium]
MAFEQARFIKPDIPFVHDYATTNPAPLFRRRFSLPKFKRATLSVCGLGYGHYWLNGQSVTSDKFTAPVSDYNKTLWYYSYDVTSLLREGENIAAVACGNGFYNETFRTSWNHNQATWRDNPKFIWQLEVDGCVALVSDDEWLCQPNSATTYNQLRSGEYFDARLYDANWVNADYDDSAWQPALVDDTPPRGTLRACACQPMVEGAVYPAVNVRQTGDKRYVYDIGQNISGYVRLRIQQTAGNVITIRYAEQLYEDGTLNLNKMDVHYPDSPFMTDKVTCSGEEFTWSPMFVYHGFRYIELDGLTAPLPLEQVAGVFTHQDIKLTSTFESSDEVLNKLFKIGQMATLSNTAYMPTDCPTREKLGWANDAQASTDQFLTNYDMDRLLVKWLQDVFDAMREDGALPGIIPTGGWGFDWGNGPVSDGILFEIPHKLYLYTGDRSHLLAALPYFRRYLTYLASRADPADGLVEFGLDDWAPPTNDFKSRTPAKFINAVFWVKFVRIAARAAEFAGQASEVEAFKAEEERLIKLIRECFIAPDGTCTIQEQTPVAMLIYYDIYENLEPLKKQLMRLVEERDFHHACGMVGLRRLYYALNKCGLQEYAYRIITAKGYPGYRVWLDGDATTLWETWQPGASKNHHMYSDFMAWMMKTLVGINPTLTGPGFKQVVIEPALIPQLSWVKGTQQTVAGDFAVSWTRDGSQVEVLVTIPQGVRAEVRLPGGRSELLERAGEHRFSVTLG